MNKNKTVQTNSLNVLQNVIHKIKNVRQNVWKTIKDVRPWFM